MSKDNEVLYTEEAIAGIKDELMSAMEEMMKKAMETREAKAAEDNDAAKEKEDAIAALEAEKQDLASKIAELESKLTSNERSVARAEVFANFGLASDNEDHQPIIAYLLGLDNEVFATVQKFAELIQSAKADDEDKKKETDDKSDKGSETDEDKTKETDDTDAAEKNKEDKRSDFLKKDKDKKEDKKEDKKDKAKANLDVPNKTDGSDDKIARFRKGLQALEGETMTIERKGD